LLEIRKITNYIEMFLNLKTSLHLKLKAKVYEKMKKTGKLRWHLRKGRAAFFKHEKTKKTVGNHGFSPSKNPTKKQNPRNFQQDPLNGPLNLGI